MLRRLSLVGFALPLQVGVMSALPVLMGVLADAFGTLANWFLGCVPAEPDAFFGAAFFSTAVVSIEFFDSGFFLGAFFEGAFFATCFKSILLSREEESLTPWRLDTALLFSSLFLPLAVDVADSVRGKESCCESGSTPEFTREGLLFSTNLDALGCCLAITVCLAVPCPALKLTAEPRPFNGVNLEDVNWCKDWLLDGKSDFI